jgi:hypothetical protein
MIQYEKEIDEQAMWQKATREERELLSQDEAIQDLMA